MKKRNNNLSRGVPGCQGNPGHSPLLIKGTSRREKVRKNLNPPEKSKRAEHSRSRPSTYLRNIEKRKKEKKSWYQYVFLGVARENEATGRVPRQLLPASIPSEQSM